MLDSKTYDEKNWFVIRVAIFGQKFFFIEVRMHTI